MAIELELQLSPLISATTIQALFTKMMTLPLVYVLRFNCRLNLIFGSIPLFTLITAYTLSPGPTLFGEI